MQIPPATNRSMKNTVVLRELLEEIRSTRFTGYCVVTLENTARSLVFSEGVCILAETPQAKGSEAYGELQSLEDSRISAVLYGLSPSQVNLTVKFNETCRLGGDTSAKKFGAKASSTTVIKAVASKGQPGRVVKIKTVSKTEPSAEHRPERRELGGEPPHEPAIRKAGAGEIGGDRISLDALKGLKDSFRFDAASLLKELDLEHLIIETKEPAHQKKPIGSPEKDKC